MPEIHELLNATNYQDYMREIPVDNGLIGQLFPERRIESFELEYIVGAGEVPIAASVHSQDSETQIAEREGLEIVKHDLAEARRKIKLDAKAAEIIETPRSDSELQAKVLDLFNDAFRLRQSVETRFKAMAWEVFTTGKLVFDENGYTGTVDYKLPAAHIKAISPKWDAKTSGNFESDVLKDLQDWADLIQSNQGVRPNRALTSQRVINIVLQNAKIRTAMHGVNAGRMVSLPELNGFLSSMGLPELVAYDEKYRVQKLKGVGYDTKRYTPEDTVVLYVDGPQGSITYGRTDEELVYKRANQNSGISVGNIFVDTFTDFDPPAFWTRAAGKGLPSFPSANQVFIAQKVITL